MSNDFRDDYFWYRFAHGYMVWYLPSWATMSEGEQYAGREQLIGEGYQTLEQVYKTIADHRARLIANAYIPA